MMAVPFCQQSGYLVCNQSCCVIAVCSADGQGSILSVALANGIGNRVLSTDDIDFGNAQAAEFLSHVGAASPLLVKRMGASRYKPDGSSQGIRIIHSVCNDNCIRLGVLRLGKGDCVSILSHHRCSVMLSGDCVSGVSGVRRSRSSGWPGVVGSSGSLQPRSICIRTVSFVMGY